MFQDKPIKSKSTDGRSSNDNTDYPHESSQWKNLSDNKKLVLELLGLEESRKQELKLAQEELLRITGEYNSTNKSISKLHDSKSIIKRAHKWGDSLYKGIRANSTKCRKIYRIIANNLEAARNNIKTCELIYTKHYEETLKKVHEYKNEDTLASMQVKNHKEQITLLRNEIDIEKLQHKKKLLELKKHRSDRVSKYEDLSTKIDKLNYELAKQKEENAGVIKNIEKTESINLNIQAEINKLDTDLKGTKEDLTSIQNLNENNAALLTTEGVELKKTVQKKLNNNSDIEKKINSSGDNKATLEDENANLSAIKEKANMNCAEIEALFKSEDEKQMDASHKNQLRSQEVHKLIKILEYEHKLIINELLNKTELVQSLTSKLQKDEETNHNLQCDIEEMQKNLAAVEEQIENDEKKYEHMLSEFKNFEQELDKSIEKANKLNLNVISSNGIYENQKIRLTNEAIAIEMDIKYQGPVELENISKMLDAEEKEQATKDELGIETAEVKLSDLRKQLKIIESDTKDVQKTLNPLDVECNTMASKVNSLQQSNKTKKRAIQRDRKSKPTQSKIPRRAERKQSLEDVSTSSQ